MSREQRDFYPTPHWCFDILTPFINWNKIDIFYEPCCGDNRITLWAIKNNVKKVIAEDLRKDNLGQDYLKANYNDVSLILTNPPFSLAYEFTVKALKEAKCVCMLHRLGFLGSQWRYDFWNNHPPTSLFILSRRPSFVNRGTDNSEYAWFVWDKADIFNFKGIKHLI